MVLFQRKSSWRLSRQSYPIEGGSGHRGRMVLAGQEGCDSFTAAFLYAVKRRIKPCNTALACTE